MMSHKKIHRFLVANLPSVKIAETVAIGDARIVHQAHAVLRLQPGETAAVFSDGGDTAIGEIISIDAQLLVLNIKAIEPAPVIPRAIVMAVSIIKGDAFELAVQKLTEIGVSTIVPLISSRTIKQQVRLDRLRLISDEAVEQCGGTKRVSITEPMSLEQCLAAYPFQKIVFDPLATTTVPERHDDSILCLVGPEGGWSEQDEQSIEAAHCQHLRLTDRVLRTETAAIVGAYRLLWQ